MQCDIKDFESSFENSYLYLDSVRAISTDETVCLLVIYDTKCTSVVAFNVNFILESLYKIT